MPTTEITITGKVDTDKVPLLKEYFLKAQPIPKDKDPESPTYGDDMYSFNEWLKKRIWSYVRGEIKQGKKELDAQAADLDNIIS